MEVLYRLQRQMLSSCVTILWLVALLKKISSVPPLAGWQGPQAGLKSIVAHSGHADTLLDDQVLSDVISTRVEDMFYIVPNFLNI